MTQDASSDSNGSLPKAAIPVETPRLLIVEDNADARAAMVSYFTERGWLVKTAYSLGAALVMADLHRPHVIISELALPDVRGYRFVDAYRRAAPDPRVKIIAVTRLPDQLMARAKSYGFDEVFAKPVDLEALHALIAP